MRLRAALQGSPCFVAFVWVAIIWSQQCNAYSGAVRWKRQSCGKPNQFQCKSGECVSEFYLCDGETQCKDGSDETAEACKNVPCPSYAFRCQYGACVDSDAKCNGKKDCADNSDEKGCGNSETQSGCKRNQFECKSGTCLDPFLLCDGTKDCDDGTDETKEVCGSFRCPQYSFQCKYGACIDQDGKCNGIVQCADGSDESPELCGKITTTTTTTTTQTPPPSTSSGCVLPEQPTNGRYQVGGCNTQSCSLKSGSHVKEGTFMRYTCENGFKLSGSNILLCESGWSSSIPTCSKVLCPELVFPSREIECELDGKKVECNKPVAPGTKALIRCNTQYTHNPEFAEYNSVCEENGQWSRQVTACEPKCGIINAEGLPFVANGIPAKRGQFPWHAGIYRKSSDGTMEQMCGGSIVAPRVIVTAAHCFWDDTANKQVDFKNYRVLVGKHFLDWNTRVKPDYVQEHDINNVVLQDRFIGEVRNYAHDIAVIILNVDIHMTVAVRPICVDYKKTYTYLFTPGKSGVVVGWGFTENNTQSIELHTATLPQINFEECEKAVPQSFLPFLTFDKFCAGYRNGTSVCRGDSGGGYATEFRDGRWYLMGIVSVGVPSNSYDCNIFQYTTYTRVSEYYDFIQKYVR